MKKLLALILAVAMSTQASAWRGIDYADEPYRHMGFLDFRSINSINDIRLNRTIYFYELEVSDVVGEGASWILKEGTIRSVIPEFDNIVRIELYDRFSRTLRRISLDSYKYDD